MLLAADYPFLDVLWTMIIFFAWVIWIWILISILTDLFRRHDVSGVDEGALGDLPDHPPVPRRADLPDRQRPGHGRAERQAVEAAAAIAGPATQIAHAKQLLDNGAINQEEFEAIKRKAMAD